MTTITESFNTADSTTLGPDQTWTELDTAFSIVSNQCKLDKTFAFYWDARCETALSSVDHYAQISCESSSGTPIVWRVHARMDASARTYYSFEVVQGTGVTAISKTVSGTRTVLGTGSAATVSLPDTIKIEVNGTTIKGFWNGTELASLTDSSITTGVRCGFGGNNDSGSSNQFFDNFEAADLASGITADLSATLGATSVSTDGAVLVKADGLTTLANSTIAAVGAVDVVASLAQTTENISLSATGGAAENVAELSVVFADATLSATGAVGISVDAPLTLENASANSAVAVLVTANLNQLLDDETLASDVDVVVTADLSKTLDVVTLVATGGAALSIADLAQTLANASLTSAGVVIVVGDSSVTLNALTLSSEGTNDSPVIAVPAQPASSRRSRRQQLPLLREDEVRIPVTGQATIHERERDRLIARGRIIDLDGMTKERRRVKMLQILALAA